MVIRWVRDFELPSWHMDNVTQWTQKRYTQGSTLECLQVVPCKTPGKSNIQIAEDDWMFNIPNEMFAPFV